MFTITYENELHRQWGCEYIFNSFEDAKKYLTEKGFIEKNRLFERSNYNWSTYLKAYIKPMKVYPSSN